MKAVENSKVYYYTPTICEYTIRIEEIYKEKPYNILQVDRGVMETLRDLVNAI